MAKTKKNNFDRGFDIDKIDANNLRDALKNKGRTRPNKLLSKPLHNMSKENIIELIFQKMQQKGGFPSFSKQISDINKILKLKYASAKDIADVIIQDLSLSNKLLTLSNSSFYGQFGQGGITSIEKAIIVLGADQVQQSAASLMLFDHMQASSYSKKLKTIALKTFMSGLIAKEIAYKKSYIDTDEFLICSMFYKLGENLIAYYFPEKRKVIELLSDSNEVSDSMASHAVLGITYRSLGIGVGEKWGLPTNIIECMKVKKPHKKSLTTFKDPRVEMLGSIAALSNKLCDIQFKVGNTSKNKEINKALMFYHVMLGLKNDAVKEILWQVLKKIKTHSSQLNINIDTFQILSDI